MTPIINPWLFYFIGVSENISTLSCILAGAFGIVIFIYGSMFIYYVSDYPQVLDENHKNEFNFHMKWVKRFFISFLFFIFTALAIPSEKTLYKMAVAYIVTPDNISIAGDTAVEVIDYLTEKVDQMINDNNN